MLAVEIDMRAGPAEPIITFRLEGEGLRRGKQLFCASLHFLPQRLLSGAPSAVARLRTVPTNQAQSNAFGSAIGEALQFERVAIDRKHIAHRRIDTARARLGTQVFRLWGQGALRTGGDEGGEKNGDRTHEGNKASRAASVNWKLETTI